MIHGFAAKMDKTGVSFPAARLAYMGIVPRVICWGLWVEGRGGIERCRRDLEINPFEFQAPHLIVSPIRPELWTTAFSIQALLERKPQASKSIAAYDDSLHGITDALRTCGVNILSAQSAQVGYDLVALNAVCELSELREPARHLLEELADVLHACVRGRTHDAQLELERHRIRVDYFKRLGGWVVTRLAELQARLVHMDRVRFILKEDPWAALSFADKQNSRKVRDLMTGCWRPNIDSDDPWIAPWYLNGKVIEAGENTYYLGRNSFRTSDRIRDLATSSMGLHNQGAAPERDRALDDFYEAHRRELCRRRIAPPMKEFIPDHEELDVVQHFESGEELEVWNTQRFFERQSLLPIRITAMPSLAYARIWAFLDNAKRPFSCAFKCESKRLVPYDRRRKSRTATTELVHTLNVLSGLAELPGAERFECDASVFVNVHLPDCFMRVRFLRAGFAARACARIHVTYSAVAALEPGVDSRGLVAEALRVIAAHGLRVERLRYRFPEMDDEDSEKGDLDIMVKATNTVIQSRLNNREFRRRLQSEIEHAVAKRVTPHAKHPPKATIRMGVLPGKQRPQS